MATSPQSGAPQSERVTFLTSRQQKAALDAFAASRGESVGNVVREATARYMAQPEDDEDSDEARELAAIVAHLVEVLPEMQASLDRMIATTTATIDEVERKLREAGIRQ